MRFAKEGRTIEAAYDAWKSLSFDPSKDNTEELINKVIELAEKLGYNEDAQVMAIKSVLPRHVYGLCLTMKTTKELKEFLVELFANPRMREAVSGTSTFSGDTTTFSMEQQVSMSIVNPTVADTDKIKNDTEVMQNSFNKMSTADSRTRMSNRPWKPQVTPPRKRGGFNRGTGGRQFDNSWINGKPRCFDNGNGSSKNNNNQQNGGNSFRNKGQGNGNPRGGFRGRG